MFFFIKAQNIAKHCSHKKMSNPDDDDDGDDEDNDVDGDDDVSVA